MIFQLFATVTTIQKNVFENIMLHRMSRFLTLQQVASIIFAHKNGHFWKKIGNVWSNIQVTKLKARNVWFNLKLMDFSACDAKCNMLQSLADLSHDQQVAFWAESGGNIVSFIWKKPLFHQKNQIKMLTKLGDICSAARCFLPCYRDQLNQSCKRAGGMIVVRTNFNFSK